MKLQTLFLPAGILTLTAVLYSCGDDSAKLRNAQLDAQAAQIIAAQRGNQTTTQTVTQTNTQTQTSTVTRTVTSTGTNTNTGTSTSTGSRL
jgi:carbohydrate-binding DOMON domain-containing protein